MSLLVEQTGRLTDGSRRLLEERGRNKGDSDRGTKETRRIVEEASLSQAEDAAEEYGPKKSSRGSVEKVLRWPSASLRMTPPGPPRVGAEPGRLRLGVRSTLYIMAAEGGGAAMDGTTGREGQAPSLRHDGRRRRGRERAGDGSLIQCPAVRQPASFAK